MMAFRSPYPDYDVLSKWDTQSWDEQTRAVIERRLTQVPGRRFFTESEWQVLEAVCARLLPQPDRAEPIPIVPWIAEKLHNNWRDGFRYDDMPPAREAWRLGLAGLNQESLTRFGVDFPRLIADEQDAILRAVQSGDVESPAWTNLPASRFFTTMLLKEVVGEYYAHPAAWSEVGFGGPASPRGYVRLGVNQRDPWEAHRHKLPQVDE
jgi:hypothetical protein